MKIISLLLIGILFTTVLTSCSNQSTKNNVSGNNQQLSRKSKNNKEFQPIQEKTNKAVIEVVK